MISDEDRRNLAQLGDTATFSHIVLARQRAEDVAVKTRANRILGRLANSKARQPLRNYDVGALVNGENLAKSSSSRNSHWTTW